MVLAPMGGLDAGGLGLEMPVPEVVRQSHAKYWWAYFFLIIAAAVVELVSLDVFGVIFEGALAFIVWYMVKNSCKNMTQYCLFVFGLMCLIEALFEVLTLTTMMEGRTTSSTTSSSSTDNDGNTVVYYTTQVEETPFFDSSQSLSYNAESFGYLLSPAIMVIGAILSYFAYNEYSVSLWGDDVEEGRTQDFNRGLNRRLRDDQPQAAGGRRQGLSREASRGVAVFEGRGQRLTDD
jgi:hypothetical protein